MLIDDGAPLGCPASFVSLFVCTDVTFTCRNPSPAQFICHSPPGQHHCPYAHWQCQKLYSLSVYKVSTFATHALLLI